MTKEKRKREKEKKKERHKLTNTNRINMEKSIATTYYSLLPRSYPSALKKVLHTPKRKLKWGPRCSFFSSRQIFNECSTITYRQLRIYKFQHCLLCQPIIIQRRQPDPYLIPLIFHRCKERRKEKNLSPRLSTCTPELRTLSLPGYWGLLTYCTARWCRPTTMWM